MYCTEKQREVKYFDHYRLLFGNSSYMKRMELIDDIRSAMKLFPVVNVITSAAYGKVKTTILKRLFSLTNNDYTRYHLLATYLLFRDNKYLINVLYKGVHNKDIAKCIGISYPSIHRCMHKLVKHKMLPVSIYTQINMTTFDPWH